MGICSNDGLAYQRCPTASCRWQCRLVAKASLVLANTSAIVADSDSQGQSCRFSLAFASGTTAITATITHAAWQLRVYGFDNFEHWFL